jgi:ribosomal subunit interface protein
VRELEVVFDENNLGWRVELIAHIQRKKSVVATVQHKEVLAAIDLAHDKMERLLTRQKEKVRSRRNRVDAAAVPSAGPSGAQGEEE